MKGLFLIWVALLLSSHQAFANFGYQQHRIAISADGNNQADHHPEARWPRADEDDWAGTAATLAMLAKVNLQHKLVHYSYNNFIDAPKHTTEINYMHDSVVGSIERWNFDSKVFFDVPEDPNKAKDHLVAEILKSSATDPLYFVHMGPSEFLYQVVKQVIDAGGKSSLQHLYIVSHSGYNDNHLRRKSHHTLNQALALSENVINYKKIRDQNACDKPDVLWCSKDFSVFHWMKDHQDPNLQWLYSRMLPNPKKKADISDAGMVYYLITGDEEGNPEKFRAFLGKGI